MCILGRLQADLDCVESVRVNQPVLLYYGTTATKGRKRRIRKTERRTDVQLSGARTEVSNCNPIFIYIIKALAGTAAFSVM